MIFCVKELSTEQKLIFFALASLLYIPSVQAINDLQLQVTDEIKAAEPVVKKSVVKVTTPPASIMADAGSLIAVGVADSIETINDQFPYSDTAILEQEKLKKLEAQVSVDLETMWVVAKPVIEKNQIDSFSTTSSCS